MSSTTRDYFYRVSSNGKYAIKLSTVRSYPGFGDISFIGNDCVQLRTTRSPSTPTEEPEYYTIPENIKFFTKHFRPSDINLLRENQVRNPMALYIIMPSDGDLAFNVYSGNKVYLYKNSAYQLIE